MGDKQTATDAATAQKPLLNTHHPRSNPILAISPADVELYCDIMNNESNDFCYRKRELALSMNTGIVHNIMALFYPPRL